ncbi:cilia- and flagella-associated protein 57-like [Oratosquilla oratoria]|uniref:cilia- and flagella-associated protein 57-like n=1 Tax=Oratosquilla oratoria TaxID=337810 RepID=UPI003F770C26
MRVCEPSAAAVVSGRGEHTVEALSVSPDERHIVLATHTLQLFTNILPNLESTKLPNLLFRVLHALHHERGILGAATCLWKPVVLTTGGDRTLRVWDYEKNLLLMNQPFREDIFSIALHPSGLNAALGLTDALRLVHLLFDCVRPYHQLKIRRCDVCSFSPGGQLLAAADGALVTVISSVTLRMVHILKGHSSKVVGLGWYPDDAVVVAARQDGSVVGWDVRTGSQIWQVRSGSSCVFLYATLSLDNQSTLVAGHTRGLAEVTAGQMVQDIRYDKGELTCATLAPVKTLMALGTSQGQVALNRYPLHMAQDFVVTQGHHGKITKFTINAFCHHLWVRLGNALGNAQRRMERSIDGNNDERPKESKLDVRVD